MSRKSNRMQSPALYKRIKKKMEEEVEEEEDEINLRPWNTGGCPGQEMKIATKT